MKFNGIYKWLFSIVTSCVVSVTVVGIFSLFFLFHYAISMEERMYDEIKYHEQVDLHHVCDAIACVGLFYNGKFFDMDIGDKKVKLKFDEQTPLPNELLKYENVSLRTGFSFMIPMKMEDYDNEAYYFIETSHFTPTFVVLFVILFIILSAFIVAIIGVIAAKEKIQHEIETNKDKSALQFENLMFYIENLNHEVNSPLFILSRKLKDIERASTDIDRKQFEIINNSIEQIGAVMQRTREVKKINKSSEDRTIYDLIESTILTISVMRAEKIISKTDIRLKDYYLDQALISNGMFINILTNHVKNSIEAFADTLSTDFVKFSKNKLVFTFTDNGNGVSAEVRKKLFDRGFSTKGTKSVRGAGLSINKSIAESVGGSIRLTDKSPGAQFEIIIPVQENHGKKTHTD